MFPTLVENSTLNGSFLVLNLGNNTVGLGNSSSFPVASNAFDQNAVEPTPKLTAVSNMDTSSNSTEEASSASESQKCKRASREMEDPEWVPEKRARKSSISASRMAKPKPGPSVGKNPSETPPGACNSMSGSNLGPPSPYLVNLLKFFGWRVIFRPGFGDHAYISPNGIAYYSLPKAFETFLHGTSKYKDKAWGASQFRENRGLHGTFVGGLSARNVGQQSGAAADGNCIAGLLSSNVGLQIGSAAESNFKKGKSTKTRNSTIRENVEPEMTTEKPPQLKQGSVYKISKDSSKMPGLEVSEGVNQVVSSSKVDEKTKSHVEDKCLGNESKQMAGSCHLTKENDRPCKIDTRQDGKLPGVRKSIGISGRHFPVGSEVDKAETNDNYLYLSACGVSGDAVNAVRNKEEQILATSQAKNVLDRMPEVSMIDQSTDNEVRKSNCSSMGVTSNAQSCASFMEKDRQVVGIRRSRCVSKENIPVDSLVMVENSLASSKSVVNTAARKNVGKSLFSESAIDEKMHFSMRDKCLSSEAHKVGCSTAILSRQIGVNDVHQSGDVPGVRRFVRIHGKHVPVDDELDTEMGVDDDRLDMSKFAANTVVRDKEKLTINFSGLDNKEGRSPESDDSQLKQTNSKKYDSQNFNTRKQVESHGSRKINKAKKPGSGKSSASRKEIELAKSKPVGGGNLNTKQKKKRNHGCSLIVRRNGKDDHHEGILPPTKLTILSWLMDSGILTENEKLVCIAKNSMGKIPSGLVTSGGIWCDCCKDVEPLSKFKAHVGSNFNQPWDYIFLMSGKTLTHCLQEAWEKEKKHKKVGFQTVGTDGPDPSDDTCGVCADGGRLICCDNCPSTFHQDCVMLKAFPEGTWYCPYCRCTFCMVAEHGSKRAPETSALLSCKQCRRKYHQQCAWGNDVNEIGSVSISFCGKNCKKLATQLSDMLGVTNFMERGFSWTLLKRLDEDVGVSSNERLSFITECNIKLSMALCVLNECFVPLMDQRTGVDVISQAIYNCGSNFNRLNYEGFYTLILEKDEEIISVASLRFHGTNLAEMPFVGTRPIYQRQGMCHRLLKAIEDLLSSLCIKKLIIPAVPDLLETWMKSFSFKPLEPSFRDEIRNLSIVVFAKTTLLQKSICNIGAVDLEDDMQTYNSISHENKMGNNHQPSTSGEHSKAEGFVMGDQDRKNHEYNTEKQKDDIPEHWRVTSDLSEIQYPIVSYGSVFDSLPAYDTLMPNLETVSQSLATAPLSFPPVNMVLDHNLLSTEVISTPDNQINSWLQSANEARDAKYDAITCILSFEKFLRMRS
ncbi:uncharacterized protein LOC103714273 isoform X2 [Phoenix dactylifera]|uniref:Uncharacterized protein LOC103714273 isoform X2 n=1 Tax=Phoenix dactylifera TaxID=42345 RepID=A0A8B8J866_PHODC|nr:uncharacterized protein LOC103714273 isoform X2 [Phoenix dactylifera]